MPPFDTTYERSVRHVLGYVTTGVSHVHTRGPLICCEHQAPQDHNWHMAANNTVPPQGRARDVLGQLHPRVSESPVRLHTCIRISTANHADYCTRRLIHVHEFGSSCSSSASRRILALVRAQMLVPNQSHVCLKLTMPYKIIMLALSQVH